KQSNSLSNSSDDSSINQSHLHCVPVAYAKASATACGQTRLPGGRHSIIQPFNHSSFSILHLSPF
ncbi:MAG: hypothetical protein ACLFM7_10065, partial [Bacteroidales bacterium]